MAKGFKDSSGKFHPTGNNRTSSREKSIETSGMMLGQQDKDHLELLKSGRIEGVHDPQREHGIKELEGKSEAIKDARIVAGKIALNGDNYELGVIEQEPFSDRYFLKKNGIISFESSDFDTVERRYDDILTEGDISEMEMLLNEYTHTTLTQIRQEDAINFLNKNGVPIGRAINFIRIELNDAPLARIGSGFGDGT